MLLFTFQDDLSSLILYQLSVLVYSDRLLYSISSPPLSLKLIFVDGAMSQ